MNDFEGLNGAVVTRDEMAEVRETEMQAGNVDHARRIEYALQQFPDEETFKINVGDKGLAGPNNRKMLLAALDKCGRLKKGYKFKKGGDIVKVEKKKKAKKGRKKPSPKKTVSKAKKSVKKPAKSEQTKLKLKDHKPVKEQTFKKKSAAPEEWKKADTRKSTSLLKKYLKEKYGIKTRVKSESYSGGSSLNVWYDLGPDDDIVEKELKRLQYNDFDGMTDTTNIRDKSMRGIVLDGYILDDYGYVFVDQYIPDDFNLILVQAFSDTTNFAGIKPFDGTKEGLNERFDEMINGAWTWPNFMFRSFRKRNFPTQNWKELSNIKCHEIPNSSWEIYFTFEWKGKQYDTRKPIIKETSMVKEKTIVVNEIKLIDQPGSKIAVIGHTGEIAGKLEDLGGIKSKSIKNDGKTVSGFIFSKNDLNEVSNVLIDYSKESNVGLSFAFDENQKKNEIQGLNGTPPDDINYEDTLKWAEENLKGKHITQRDIGKRVYFTVPKIKKAINSKGVQRTRLQLVYKAPDLLQKARLFTKKGDKKKRKNDFTFYRLRTKTILDGKGFEVIITLREDKNGVLYYDHTGVELKRQNSGRGNKSTPLRRATLPSSGNKDKKKSKTKPKNRKNGKKGLKNPVATPPETPKDAKTDGKPIPSGFTMASEGTKKKADTFRLKGEMGKFLGDLQRFRLAILLQGDPHAGKSEMCGQLANAFLDYGFSGAYFDLEQGGLSSKDTQASFDRNITPANQKKLAVTGEAPEGIESVRKVANDFDFIVIDSFQELDAPVSAFNDLRKDFPNTIWIIIFQQNAQGGTRGGIKSAYDTPIRLKVYLVDKTFVNNYAEVEKNRGNQIGIRYNVSGKKVIDPDAPADPEPENENQNSPENSRLIVY